MLNHTRHILIIKDWGHMGIYQHLVLSVNLGAFGDGGAIYKYDGFNLKIRKIRNNGSIEKYVHEIYGRNSRLDTIQAAILDIKLKYLDENNEKRRQNAFYIQNY